MGNLHEKVGGPIWLGNSMPTIETSDEEDGSTYRIQWLPDRNNQKLREAGKPMKFYYRPMQPRLVRRDGGHFIFHLQEFSGVMDPTKNIGEDGFSELAGGLLTFTSTLGPPQKVLNRSFEALKKQLTVDESNPLLFWKDDSTPPIQVGPVPLHENKTVLHELRPENKGSNGNGAGPAPWAFEIQGTEAGGTTNVEGSNAFSVMLGSRPVQMLKASAERGSSQITLENRVKYRVWSLVTHIRITGTWDSVFKHFSAHLKGSVGPFSPLDMRRITDKLVQESDIEVEINHGSIDIKQQQNYEKTADAIADNIRKMVEDKLKDATKAATESMKEEPAKTEGPENSGNRGLWGIARGFLFGSKPQLGLALKSRKQEFKGSFEYKKEINKQVLRDDILSSQMEGLFDEISENDEAHDRYFSKVFFEEGFRKVHVVARANANWQENGKAGDPIDSVNLQVGYPDSEGNLNWKSAARFKENEAQKKFSAEPSVVSWTPNTKNRLYAFDFTRHESEDRPNEQVHLKKMIRFKESPDVAVEELVETEETDTHVVEVRADSAGHLNVGPISLDMPIGKDNDQIQVKVMVKTPTFGEKVFSFDHTNENKERNYSVWYASEEEIEPYEYKVEAIVKGRRFGQQAIRWEGEWQEQTGSGALVAEIPPVPEDLETKMDEYLGAE